MKNEALTRQAAKIDQYRSSTKSSLKTISGLELIVLPHVFPGGTDTGLLCDTLQINRGEKVLDIGTGTGAAAIKAAVLGAGEVWATDVNPDAIQNARQNQTKFGIQNANFLVADIFPPKAPMFDVITMNPPYTDAEAPDITARCFWDKENHVVKTFFQELPKYLAPTGRAYISWASFARPSLLSDLSSKHKYAIRQINQTQSDKSGFQYYIYEVKLP